MYQTPALMEAHRLMCKERDEYISVAERYEPMVVHYRERAQEITDVLGYFGFTDAEGSLDRDEMIDG